MLSGGLISCSSKQQKCVALSTAELSTAETEYVALSAGAAQECLWLRQLEKELECSSDGPT